MFDLLHRLTHLFAACYGRGREAAYDCLTITLVLLRGASARTKTIPHAKSTDIHIDCAFEPDYVHVVEDGRKKKKKSGRSESPSAPSAKPERIHIVLYATTTTSESDISEDKDNANVKLIDMEPITATDLIKDCVTDDQIEFDAPSDVETTEPVARKTSVVATAIEEPKECLPIASGNLTSKTLGDAEVTTYLPTDDADSTDGTHSETSSASIVVERKDEDEESFPRSSAASSLSDIMDATSSPIDDTEIDLATALETDNLKLGERNKLSGYVSAMSLTEDTADMDCKVAAINTKPSGATYSNALPEHDSAKAPTSMLGNHKLRIETVSDYALLTSLTGKELPVQPDLDYDVAASPTDNMLPLEAKYGYALLPSLINRKLPLEADYESAPASPYTGIVHRTNDEHYCKKAAVGREKRQHNKMLSTAVGKVRALMHKASDRAQRTSNAIKDYRFKMKISKTKPSPATTFDSASDDTPFLDFPIDYGRGPRRGDHWFCRKAGMIRDPFRLSTRYVTRPIGAKMSKQPEEATI